MRYNWGVELIFGNNNNKEGIGCTKQGKCLFLKKKDEKKLKAIDKQTRQNIDWSLVRFIIAYD